MSTSKNIQMATVLVNVSRNRIATDNDIAKHEIIEVINKLYDDKYAELFDLDEQGAKNSEYLRHMLKHIRAIESKLGAPELKKAVVPTQKFQIIEE